MILVKICNLGAPRTQRPTKNPLPPACSQACWGLQEPLPSLNSSVSWERARTAERTRGHLEMLFYEQRRGFRDFPGLFIDLATYKKEKINYLHSVGGCEFKFKVLNCLVRAHFLVPKLHLPVVEGRKGLLQETSSISILILSTRAVPSGLPHCLKPPHNAVTLTCVCGRAGGRHSDQSSYIP